MAVYTEVSFERADTFVRSLGAGALLAIEPILAGIENTNYFASTTGGEWVLTLFERLHADELPFYLRLMQHLAQRGVPAPQPRADAEGRLLHRLCGKPAALLERLPGHAVTAPGAEHRAQVGAMLARLHLAAADFPAPQPNPRGLAWWRQTVPQVIPFVDGPQGELLRDELSFLERFHAHAALPGGVIHADLFRDNTVFEDVAGAAVLRGIFDFFFAGVDAWALDIAVCLNDWCIDPASGRLIGAQAEAFVAAYESVRELQPSEREALPALRRAAAFRFWLSRLWDLHLPRDAALLRAKDPGHFERVLRLCREQPWQPLHPTP